MDKFYLYNSDNNQLAASGDLSKLLKIAASERMDAQILNESVNASNGMPMPGDLVIILNSGRPYYMPFVSGNIASC